MTQSPSSSSSISSLLAGMGLFLATAAVSQWIQNHHKLEQERKQKAADRQHRQRRRRRRRQDTSTSYDDGSFGGYTSVEGRESSGKKMPREDILSKEAFERRRLARRMSFERLQDGDETMSPLRRNSSTSNEGEPGKQETTEWSLHHRSIDNPKSSSSRIPAQKQIQIQSQQSYHDFHPKYQNWRHFERTNEWDRARQRRKSSRQQQQQQVQSRSSQKQDAGEGASQNVDIETKKQSLPQHQQLQPQPQKSTESQRSNRQHNHSEIDNGSDVESTWTDDDDNDQNNDDSSSADSFGSGNQYVWTASRNHRDESSRSVSSFGSNPHVGNISTETRHYGNDRDIHKSLEDSSMQPLTSRSGAVTKQGSPSHGGMSSKNNNATDSNDQMDRFQRFYRMLTSSIMDDDTDVVIEGSSAQGSNRISLSSSNSSNLVDSMDYDGDIEDRHRALRTEYNAQIMPEKLVLIRHGQSMGNVDETFYATTPDNQMPLTDLGWEQAHKAGTILKDKILTPGESVHFIVSPYVRTVETFHGILSAWCDPESDEFAAIYDHNRKVNAWYERLTELGLTWNEDSRIREQDFGNYQNPERTKKAKEERHRFGAFYYRFNNGESGSDVFDRVSTFLDSLWRSFETNKSQNYVLVTHGIVLRVLMARYFRYTISQLNMLANPRNCEMVVLGHAGDGRLDLEGRCALELEEDSQTRRTRVKGYKFHKRLRILPKSHIRTVQFRISPRDNNK